ncbi:MAG: ABC transporter ATP-binding protein [Ignavibacteriales bacterium]|nr:ABC transporter ATP-binding protein [Ignavibacteriales bacterium]
MHFKIEESDFISIMGPNGSGKSTLLKIIANLLKPFSGNVLLDDVDYSLIPRNVFARKVSFVPLSSSKVFFPYSVYEIVMMGRTPHLNYFGIENEIDHNKVIEVLELLEIDHLKNKGINEVSGGEAQRALIARALVQEPKIMLLDEPNAHLDIKHQVSIFNILLKLNKEFGLTVVLISHDLNLANFFSNRVVLMNNGKIEFDSAPKEVLTEDNIKLIFNVNSKVMKSINSPETFINISPKL